MKEFSNLSLGKFDFCNFSEEFNYWQYG